jgi:hypothetical protein
MQAEMQTASACGHSPSLKTFAGPAVGDRPGGFASDHVPVAGVGSDALVLRDVVAVHLPLRHLAAVVAESTPVTEVTIGCVGSQ